MKEKLNLFIVLIILLLVGLNCSFSTANISDLKFGLNDKASPSFNEFKNNDTVHIRAEVTNIPFPVEIKIAVFDAKNNKVAEESEIFADDKALILELSHKSGIPRGVYRVEATLFDESDKKLLDQKTGSFTVR